MELARTQFEPHGGYGQTIDGEPMPFGYLSKEGVGRPIFELSPLLSLPEEELRAHALAAAAAPDLLAVAGRPLVHQIEESEGTLRLSLFGIEVCAHRSGTPEAAALMRLEAEQRAAIRLAETGERS